MENKQQKDNSNKKKMSTAQIFMRTAVSCFISGAIVVGGTSLFISHQVNKWMDENLTNINGVNIEKVSSAYGLASVEIKSKIVIATNKFPEISANIPNVPPYITAIATTKFGTSSADTHLQLLGDSAKLLSDYIQRNQLKFKNGAPSNYERNATDGSLDLPIAIHTTYSDSDHSSNAVQIKYDTKIVFSDTISNTGAIINGLTYDFGGYDGKITHTLTQLKQIRVPTPHNKDGSLLNIENVKFSRIYVPDGLIQTTTPIESIDSGRLDVDTITLATETNDYRILPVIDLQKLLVTYNLGNEPKTVSDIDDVKKDKQVNYPLSLTGSLTAEKFLMVDTNNKNINAEISLSGISGLKLKELLSAYDQSINTTAADQARLKQSATELVKAGMNVDNLSLHLDNDDGEISSKLTMQINPSAAQLITKDPLAAIAGVDIHFTASLPANFVQKTAIIPQPVISKLIQMDFIKVVNNRLDTDIHLDNNQLIVNGEHRTL
ncbi:DUF945 family protein [Photobacterium carnosum]|uniref:DUF945 domain-containing protein n=2 Tax=Photobacterium carnosum TaxID=2023717 RepID=A0A2N4UW21_9GAMM|nr:MULTISPECIES: DUF945 family protein [Photobacterium]MCD9475822.1 DUF945 family protein [Photobacterium phosphoreum]MCD9485873.1 DUF945 family protein [Photobacterium iliopiscarium]MCD9507684.1 DUF945 family protein [Photobacterium phosphoreum]MCD9538195.1 DUF945 family protein [Photobacterium carnosum]MCD9542999.1 DUF945 family protein [Photobacterium carnosum]